MYVSIKPPFCSRNPLTSMRVFHIYCGMFFYHCSQCVSYVSAEVGSRRWAICVGSIEDGGVVTDSPHTGLLLSTSSKTLPTTDPGMASTSGHTAISTRDQQGQYGADRDCRASALVHFIRSRSTVWFFSPTQTAEETLLSVKTHSMFCSLL